MLFVTVVCLFLAGLCIALWRRQLVLRRESYIRSFVLPTGLFEKLRQHYPQLSAKECQLVSHGLRQFFLAHLKSGRKYVSMPSQAADELWHEFILYTKNYQLFCQKAFGRFLHHTPAVVLSNSQASNAGMRRCWRYACLEENINPVRPTRLPLLFALDGKLNILNGFHYVADCEASRKQRSDGTQGAVVYCGGDFSSAGFDGGTDGLDASGSGDGDGAGAGAGDGCGGGGCGGGCGGD